MSNKILFPWAKKSWQLALRILLGASAIPVAAVLVWQGLTVHGNPDPTLPQTSQSVAILNIGVLVFREGLECVLVLSAITASLMGSNQQFRHFVAAGAAVGFVATLLTWFVAVGIIADLASNIPALDVQAATGLLAVIVLLIVMNWFFHKVYWTGWISMHNRKKRTLLQGAKDSAVLKRRLLVGLGLLGFASFYREGFEVVLFLQSFRLRMGGSIVLKGTAVGLFLTCVVAALNFILHRHLPYKKMLIVTGVLLGCVLLIMVGEEVFEMQQALWLPTTTIAWLAPFIPAWAGVWFSVFPTVETLASQFVAAILVIGSYFLARYRTVWLPRRRGMAPAHRPESPPTVDAAATQ